MKYKISHRTLYKYETTASLSHNELFLVPGNTSYKTCESNLVHLTKDQHLTLAWGRDYGDVTPVRGTVPGGGNHRLEVAVDVIQSEG